MTMNLKNLYQNEYSFEETVNENFFKVDSFTHLSILGEITSSSDEENTIAKELYLITQPQPDANGITTPDTLFQDKINQIACYHNNIGWLFYTPKIGDIAYIRSKNGFYYFTGAQWNIMTIGSSNGGSGSTTPSQTDNTADTSTSPTIESISLNNPFTLGMIMRSKTQVNHPSWVKSDATLKSGAVYASMYFSLLDTFNNGTAGTIKIGGETYNTKEKDGFVVIDSNDWQAIYSAYGVVAQFGIDTTNQQFYLPYGEESKRVLIEKKESTGDGVMSYNLYSDGWLEIYQNQWSNITTLITINFPYEFKNTNYSILNYNFNYPFTISNQTTSSLTFDPGSGSTSKKYSVKICGYTNQGGFISHNYFDYYYVGDVVQSSYAINLDTLLTKINTLEHRVQELEDA